MDLSGKKVSVIGAAKSGIAAAELLRNAGADVLLSDFGRIDGATFSVSSTKR